MKIVLILIGSLGGIYAIVGGFLLIKTIMTSNPGSAYGGANIAASVVPVCLGLIICVACLQKAFRKPKS